MVVLYSQKSSNFDQKNVVNGTKNHRKISDIILVPISFNENSIEIAISFNETEKASVVQRAAIP